MTVIEVPSASRQRAAGLVGNKESDAPRVGGREATARKRKLVADDGSFMQEPQGCAYGDFPVVESASTSAVAAEHDHRARSRLFGGEGEGTVLSSKKQKIASRMDLPQVRGRRKSRWKLKFHHQALPPEYLRHYKQQERKRRQTETKKSNLFKSKIRKIVKKNVSDVLESKNGGEADAERREAPDDGGRGEERTREEAEAESPASSSSSSLSSASSPPSAIKLPEASYEAEGGGADGGEAHAKAALLNSNIATQLNLDITQNKAFLENLLTNQIEINRVESKEGGGRRSAAPGKSTSRSDARYQAIPSSGKIMNFSDLPYMGEITLDGIKPRRGRKPKKADICHLIYKNYGQVFPGSPGRSPEKQKQFKWKSDVSNGWNQLNSSQSTKAGERGLESPLPSVSGLINHTEVQNRIINSLLEKRLTQERKSGSRTREEVHGGEEEGREEPLNLCIRDLQSLKIKLSRKHGNFYEAKNDDGRTKIEDGIKKEVINIDNSDSGGASTEEEEDDDDEDDLAPFNLVTTELRESSDEDNFLNFSDQITLTKIKSGEEKVGDAGDPVAYWPGSNVLLPPMPVPSPLVYYQRLAGSDGGSKPSKAGKEATQGRKQVRYNADRAQGKRLASKSNPNAAHVITKRKRSAIFIPPVPAENTTNPTTEVSICKFKFTGGAKPSLQEKKMLSVDSGGNFRYYSGTGDKSMRGYEYFPRESLQQCQENTGCSPSGVFLTASALGSGEKIPEEIGHSGFFDSDFPIQVPPLKTVEAKPRTKHKGHRYAGSLHLAGEKSETSDVVLVPDDLSKDEPNSSDESGDGFDVRAMMRHNYFGDGFKAHEDAMMRACDEGLRKKSRKSKKSLAREKLEQTFKEKGFLIQTQQLESAEGATYCKFRQLRKFTRYLFRSWKDYLPGNVRDLSVDAGVEGNRILELSDGKIKSEGCEPQGKNV